MTDLITTERLVLRPPQACDAVHVSPLIGDLEVSRWLSNVPHPYGLDDARTFIEGPMSRGAWFIWQEDHLMGCVSVRIDLGYWIARPAWGQGLASEAAKAVLAHRFSMNAGEVESGHFVENQRSRNVLLKLGFVDTALRQAKCRATGECHLLQRMVLTQSAWETRP